MTLALLQFDKFDWSDRRLNQLLYYLPVSGVHSNLKADLIIKLLLGPGRTQI